MPRLAPPGPVFGNCRPGVWQYHQLPASSGATCLDGSPYGFFFLDGTPVPKSEPRSMRFNESWLLLFEGGGWCWSPEDCAFRAETKSGSSSDWHHPNKSISIGGLVNKCCFCTRFCRFRRVFLKSCDGHSFAGNATIEVPPRADQPPGQPKQVLRSNGLRIITAVLDELIANFALAEAKNILIGGCSAGGMTALLNAERIRSELRDRGVRPRRFKVASLAGLFFAPPAPKDAQQQHAASSPPPPFMGASGGTLLPFVGGSSASSSSSSSYLSPFEEQLRAAVQLGNMSIPARCRDTMPAGEAWRCLLGTSLLDALPEDLPGFVWQSRLDLWQVNCILAAGRSRYFQHNCSSGHAWRGCLGWMQQLKGASKCTPKQWAALREYEEANHAALSQSPALRRTGYGSFVHSCYDHCPSPYGLINTGALLKPGAVNDSVNAREALWMWMLAEGERAWEHTHVGCWNALVSARNGIERVGWCRKPECGQPEKMHHDSLTHVVAIKKRGWRVHW